MLTGDAHFCVLESIFTDISAWWKEHDEAGGVPQSELDRLDALLDERLGGIAYETDASTAALAAKQLHFDIRPILAPAHTWEPLRK